MKRTADQCRIKWLGDRHPRFNHGEWSPAELNKLRDIIDSRRAGASNIDWFRVANELGVRSKLGFVVYDCLQVHTLLDKPYSYRLHAARHSSPTTYVESNFR